VQQSSHITPDGSIAMVDISNKNLSHRSARARARVRLARAAKEALVAASLDKGDAFAAAQIAGIMAAKQTATLIPLAHPIPLSEVQVSFAWDDDVLQIEGLARTNAATGVEMEAMVAACVAALTIYDMMKSLDKGITIETVELLEKHGGKSGSWRRASEI